MVRRAIPYALLLPLLAAGVVGAVLAVQPGDGFVREARAQGQDAAEVRIAAQRLASGATEFALQARQGDSWGELRLPSPRFLPASSPVDAWRYSGTLQLDNGVEVRIAARRLANDQIEFSLQILDVGEWSERLLPVARLFPVLPALRTWLYSSSLRAPRPTHVPYAYVNSCHIGQAIECRTWMDFRGRVTTSLQAKSRESREPEVQLEITCLSGDLLRIELRRLPIAELGTTVSVQMRLETGEVDVANWSVWQSGDGSFSVVASPRPVDHQEFLHRGQAVEIELPGTDLPRYAFSIAGLFSTPIQDNIDHCGNYLAEAARLLPPPYSASDSRRLEGNESYVNGWWREAGPRSLNEVGLRQESPLHGDMQTNDSEQPSMWFDVVCGHQGLAGGISLSPSAHSALSPDRPSPASRLRVQWSVDGGDVRDDIWIDSWAGYRPANIKEFLDVVIAGSTLDLTLGPASTLSGRLLLDAMFGTPVQPLLEQCLAHPSAPDVPRTGKFWDTARGITYHWGRFILGRWDGWVRLQVDSLSVHREDANQPMLVMTCGIDGLGIEIYGLEREFPFAASGTSVEVSWTANQTTMTDTWDLWTSNRSPVGRAISPRNDDDFYEAIRGADRLTVSSASNPRITDSFDLAGLGVWELTVIDGLDGCADALREH
ncbi:MAG: hypothetical protein OXI41_00575 [Chloroflexota bacterium]|nr:hypothetical protein [Chloroflexota bacterium]MDE2896259.1 hypothetical protein [Chloroflexota bacterium]